MNIKRLNGVFFVLLVGMILVIATGVVQAKSLPNYFYTWYVQLEEEEQLDDIDIQQSFMKLLIKVSGNMAINYDKRLKEIPVNTIKQLLLSTNVNRSSENTFWMLNFSASKINQLLKKHNYLIWHMPRPKLVVWVAEQSIGKQLRFIELSNLATPLINKVVRITRERGVVMNFARANKAERSAIGSDERVLLERLSQVSLLNYEVANPVLVSINQQSGKFQVNIAAYKKTKLVYQATMSGNNQAELLYELLQKLVNVLYGEEALQLIQYALVSLSVGGIEDYSDLQKLSKLLQSSRWFDNFTIEAATPEQLHLQLRVRGTGKEYLDDLKILDNVDIVTNYHVMDFIYQLDNDSSDTVLVNVKF